jgi:hypothetical protein
MVASLRYLVVFAAGCWSAAGAQPPQDHDHPMNVTSGTGVFGVVAVSHNATEYTEIADHRIEIASATGTRMSVKTNKHGRYTKELPPGTYALRTSTPKAFGGISGSTMAKVMVEPGKMVRVDFRFNDGTRCLDRDTPIATPDGPIAIQALALGAEVWTCAIDGTLARDRVIGVQRADAPGWAMRYAFGDGRSIVVAPDHPLADASLPRELAIGASLAGSTLTASAPARYADGHSYDLATESGRPYYASGIAMRSTFGGNVEPVAICANPAQ